MSMDRELLTVGEVASMCAVATKTINRWRDMGFCPAPLKMCKSVRWRKSDVLAWIADGCKDVRRTNWTPTATAAGRG